LCDGKTFLPSVLFIISFFCKFHALDGGVSVKGKKSPAQWCGLRKRIYWILSKDTIRPLDYQSGTISAKPLFIGVDNFV